MPLALSPVSGVWWELGSSNLVKKHSQCPVKGWLVPEVQSHSHPPACISLGSGSAQHEWHYPCHEVVEVKSSPGLKAWAQFPDQVEQKRAHSVVWCHMVPRSALVTRAVLYGALVAYAVPYGTLAAHEVLWWLTQCCVMLCWPMKCPCGGPCGAVKVCVVPQWSRQCHVIP